MHEPDQPEDDAGRPPPQPTSRPTNAAPFVLPVLIVLLCIGLAVLVQTIATRTWGDSMTIRWCVRAALLLSLAAIVARLRFGSN